MVHVGPQEPRRGDLWAFGVASIALAANVHPETVRRSIRLGRLVVTDLMMVAEWINLRRLQGRRPKTGRAEVARLARCSVLAVSAAVKRGELDLQSSASIKVWARARREGRSKPEPGPALTGFSLIRSAATTSSRKAPAWTKARVEQLVSDLRALGFATSERRGPAHVYLKPDLLTLGDAARLLERMHGEGWRAKDLDKAARRRLGVFGGVTATVDRKSATQRKRERKARRG